MGMRKECSPRCSKRITIHTKEDKSLELLKHNKLEPTKLQSYGLNRDAPLEMSLPQDDSPSGSWLANMTKEGGHLGNHAKMSQLSMAEGKPTRDFEMTNVIKLMNGVDMAHKNKSTSEIDIIQKNKLINEVDMPQSA